MSAAENKAVFLSYASQDAGAACRICETLRAAGVEVWFDQNELVGGDAWDAKIRKQIAECALFVPVISANTNARGEGYFRLEWKLAVDRSHLMAHDQPFLLPVVIDGTTDVAARVPPEFRVIQWTRLPGGETPEKFGERVKKLLGGEVAQASSPGSLKEAGGTPALLPKVGRRVPALAWIGTVVVVAAVIGSIVLRPKPNAGAGTRPPATEKPAPLSEARKLIRRAAEIHARGGRADFDAAEDLANRALALDSTDEEVLGHAARFDAFAVYMGYDRSAARKQRARERAARVMALAPESYVARRARAVVLSLAEGTPETLAEAEKIFRQLVQEAPEKNVLTELGTTLRELKRYDEAAAMLERAGDLISAAWNYQIGGRFDDAWRMSDALLAQKQTATGLLLKVAVQWAGFEDLEATYRVVSGFTPVELQNEDLVQWSAIVFSARREGERVVRLLSAHPAELFAGRGYRGPKRLLIGDGYALIGELEAARTEWRTALGQVREKLKATPQDRDALGTEAILHARLGEKDEAERVRRYYVSLSAAPSVEEKYPNLVTLAQLGRIDEVLAILGATFRAREARWEMLHAFVRFMPDFDALRVDPRCEQLLRETAPKTAKPFTAPVKTDEKSVAVLAFADQSPAHDSEYFSDGISEELINALGKVSGLKVPARTSSFYFKGKSVPVPEIAQQLGVAYVIEGSVQRLGDKVKIGARLTKAADGFQVWSDSFTRDAKDVFAVEEEIAGLIAQRLSLKLGAVPAAVTAQVNPEAVEYYLRASQLSRLRDKEVTDSEKIEGLLNRALALEPNFARAQALLAEVLVVRGAFVTSTVSRFDQRASAEQARLEARARQAIALDPTSPEAHAALSLVLWFGWDRGFQELETALSLNPSYATGYWRLGFGLMDDGRVEEALAAAKRAAQLDPFSQEIVEGYARLLHLTGRYAEALVVYDRALALADSVYVCEHKAYLLAQLGRTQEAAAMARELPESLRIRPYAAAGLRVEAEALLAKKPKPYYLLLLGRNEEALAALDVSEMRVQEMHDWLFEPWIDPIRDDPRFKKFIATLGLTEAHARAQAWRVAHPAEKADVKK